MLPEVSSLRCLAGASFGQIPFRLPLPSKSPQPPFAKGGEGGFRQSGNGGICSNAASVLLRMVGNQDFLGFPRVHGKEFTYNVPA
jgi:hypothetical protein